MTRAALRNLLAHKARAATTAVAVALGVAFMAGTLVLADTVRASLDALVADSYAGTDAYVRAEPAFSSWRGDQRPRLDANLVGIVAEVDGVAAAEGRVEGYAQLVDAEGELVGRPEDSYGAVWGELDEANPYRLVEGRAPLAADEVVIDRRNAEESGYGVGDEAQVALVSGMQSVTVVGVATFGGADSRGTASHVLFTHAAAQRLLGKPGRVDAVAVVADRGVTQAEVRDRLAAALPDGTEVLTGAELLDERRDDVTENVTRVVRTFLLVFAAVALFVGAFIIHNTFSMLVAQRGKEVALVRALGASRRQVLAAVLAEAAVVGLVGGALGAAAGIVVAGALREVVAAFAVDLPAQDVVVRPASLLVPLATGVLVTVGSAVLPARRAASIAPMAALRDVAVDRSGRSRRRIVVAGVLALVGTSALLAGASSGTNAPMAVGVGAALVFLAVAALGPVLAGPVVRAVGAPLRRVGGTPATLAVQSAQRNPRRTSGAAAALMIGIGLVTLISIFASSAKASLADPAGDDDAPTPAADFVITAAEPGFAGIDPALAPKLAALPEVAEVAVQRIAVAQVGGDATRDIVGVDVARWTSMADLGVVQGDLDQLGGDEIAVPEALAREKGWSIGELVTVRFADTGERQLRIAATTASAYGHVIDLATFEASVADQQDAMVLVSTAEGVSRTAARAAVEPVLDDHPTATLVDRRDPSQQTSEIDSLVNMVYVLLTLAVVIALMGIANTLGLSVVERTRELGVLRAVGMTRRQVRTMIRWESLLIALLGAVLGILVGLFFAWAMLQAIPDTATVRVRVPVGRLALITVIAAVAALLAAAGPARRAARLAVLDAVAAP